MPVDFTRKFFGSNPAAAHGGIHELEKRTVATPDYDKMAETVRQSHDHDGRQGIYFRNKKMIDRKQQLLRLQPQRVCD